MKNRLKRLLDAELIHPGTALAVSFLTPVTAYLIMFAMRGIYPFGDTTIFGSDLYHQYGPFFAEFRHKLLNGESLFYTWNMGLGMNFWALYVYYLASPANLLAVLVPQHYLVEFMTMLIIFKIGLCSLSMTWYLRHHFDTFDFTAALFGILYAMSGYVTAYHWNLMWMDCIILFPLILWGAEHLAAGKWGMPYCLLLGLSICSNYYISIMTCMFLVLYVPALLLMDCQITWKKAITVLGRFAGYSLLAGGAAAVLLIPEALALSRSYAGQFHVPDPGNVYFPLLQVLARHLANVRAEYEMAHWPNLYCGTIVLLLVPLYLTNRNIKRRERIVYGSLLLLLLFSFCWEPLDYIWHGFHFPNCFPARESYLYVFLVLFVSYRACLELSKISEWAIGAVCMGALTLVLLACCFPIEKYFPDRSYWLSAGYLLAYTVLILLYKKRKKLHHNVMLAVFSLVVVETAFTVTDNGMFEYPRAPYTSQDAESAEIIGELNQNSGFFRMKKTPADKVNMGAWLHYPSMDSFSSVNYFSVYPVLHQLGCEAHPNYYSCRGATPLVDMLFGTAYEISFHQKPEREFRKLVKRTENAWLYELPSAMPVGFLAGEEIEAVFNSDIRHPADLQNQIAVLSGAEPVLVQEENVLCNGTEIQFVPSQDGEYYLYVKAPELTRLTAVNGTDVKKFETWTPGCFVELGFYPKGTTASITAEGSKQLDKVQIYRFDGSGLMKIRESLVKSSWEIEQRTERELVGTIKCREAGTMVITVPYDPGWSLWVNGQQETPKEVFGTFLGVSLVPGTYQIKLFYTPPGLAAGGFLSGVCVGIILFFIWKRKRDL